MLSSAICVSNRTSGNNVTAATIAIFVAATTTASPMEAPYKTYVGLFPLLVSRKNYLNSFQILFTTVPRTRRSNQKGACFCSRRPMASPSSVESSMEVSQQTFHRFYGRYRRISRLREEEMDTYK